MIAKHEAIDQLVAANLRAFRYSMGLSQTAVASKLGVTFQQIQKYETGANRISPGRLFIASRLFGVEIGAFFAKRAK